MLAKFLQRAKGLHGVPFSCQGFAFMILGLTNTTTHSDETLRAVEGQVLDDFRTKDITKEDDLDVDIFNYVSNLIKTLSCRSESSFNCLVDLHSV